MACSQSTESDEAEDLLHQNHVTSSDVLQMHEDGWDMRAMHKKARMQIPPVPIKRTSTWIAVVYHSIHRSADIPNTNGFQFIKAHSGITTKTLRYTYFSRHPLEELFLTFNGIPLHDNVQVGHLRRASVFHDNIVVIRAIERDTTEEEEALTDEMLERFVNGGLLVPGSDNKDPISLDSDSDDSESASEAEERGVERSSDSQRRHSGSGSNHGSSPTLQNTGDQPGTDQKLNASSRFSSQSGIVSAIPAKRMSDTAIEIVDSDDGEEGSSYNIPAKKCKGAGTRMNESNGSSTLGTRVLSPDSEEERSYYGQTEANALQQTDLTQRLQDLPDAVRFHYLHNDLHCCVVCEKQMHLMPWTRFNDEDGSLCTKHSRAYLEDRNYTDVLKKFDDEVEHAADEKNQATTPRTPNMDPDFPADVFPTQPVYNDDYEYNENTGQYVPNSPLADLMTNPDYDQDANNITQSFPGSPSHQTTREAMHEANHGFYSKLTNKSGAIDEMQVAEALKQEARTYTTVHPSDVYLPQFPDTDAKQQNAYGDNDVDSPFYSAGLNDIQYDADFEEQSDAESSGSEYEHPSNGALDQNSHTQSSNTVNASYGYGEVHDSESEQSETETDTDEEVLVDAAAKDAKDDEDYVEDDGHN